FQTRVATGWSGPVPKIGVTGRAAYVAQMSGSMERDIKLTSTISILAVSGLFFLGFRRIMPLVGLTLILAMSCLTAFALGCMFFNSLNMIAIAFGSILVGLGDDFSLLLYNRYLQARRKLEDHESAIATSIGEVGKGIFYVAITTGIGFLALLFSGSAGFAQLGLLIATGLCLCALFMVTLLFLFIRPQLADERPDPFRRLVDRYLRTIWKGPARISLPIWGLCIGAVLFAVLPIRPLHFDTNPRSLEPKSLPAAQALRSIIEGFPRVADPVVLIMKAANAEESHAQWSRLTTHLQQMVDAGELASVSSPLGLMLSPERQRRNLAALGTVDLDGKLKAFDELLEKEGFNPESFTEVRALFGRLKSMHAEGTPLSDLKSVIPPSSSWWFLIDRFFSAEPNVVAAYLTPSQPLATAAAQKRLEARIKECGVPVTATGWSYAMVSLVPWAKQELLVFGSGVCGLIIVLLALAYRAWRPWLLHVLSLLFALAATIATLKLANIRVNLLNAMAFPLILGVGVDYGLHLLLAIREK
ncbi:MAG: MMPL family transporter, partial [Verrucomicrobiota bacterium]